MQFTRIKNVISNAALAVVALALVSLLALNFSGAATTTTTAPARHYYLTKATVNGNQTLTACASGYHFASFAELLDPAALTYNKTLGRTATDDGAGPPSLAYGWVRGGYPSNSTPTSQATPTNCNAWTSGATDDYGEVGTFVPPFIASETGGYYSTPAVVFYNGGACDNSQGYNFGVWCVEN